MSFTLGSPTNTCWKRRSRAGSFSIALAVIVQGGGRRPSGKLAAGQRSAEHAPASMAASLPRRARAPTHGVQLVDEGDDLAIGVRDLLRAPPLAALRTRHGTSHRRLIDARSRAIRRLRRSDSARRRRRSAARVHRRCGLAHPGSPIRNGLFLVRRDRTWMTRRISASRPITGSIRPSRARAVRSRPNFSRALKLPSGSAESTRRPPAQRPARC